LFPACQSKGFLLFQRREGVVSVFTRSGRDEEKSEEKDRELSFHAFSVCRSAVSSWSFKAARSVDRIARVGLSLVRRSVGRSVEERYESPR